ncbi:hypothetical protein XENOCAPTIV_013463 [Xenoophorus captivus]|uniref:Agouti signaling protein n=1 Tax=Xenoophorus captivus TaxID=1517983 RepID=A0ABV0SFV5_9TELE
MPVFSPHFSTLPSSTWSPCFPHRCPKHTSFSALNFLVLNKIPQFSRPCFFTFLFFSSSFCFFYLPNILLASACKKPACQVWSKNSFFHRKKEKKQQKIKEKEVEELSKSAYSEYRRSLSFSPVKFHALHPFPSCLFLKNTFMSVYFSLHTPPF